MRRQEELEPKRQEPKRQGQDGQPLLSSSAITALVAAARASSPRETCGVLIEREGALVALPRGRGQRAAFEVDARDLLPEALDGSLRGIWHTHPEGPAVLSPADAEGLWEEALALVIGLQPLGALLVHWHGGVGRVLQRWGPNDLAQS